MGEIIDKEIQSVKEDLPKLGDLSDEYLFSLVCYKYIFNKGHLDYVDYKDCFTDGKSDGGIDLITIDDSEENSIKLVMIQSKYISSLQNKQDVIDTLRKMDQTFSDFKDYRTSQYNKTLRRVFKNKLSEVEDQSPIYSLAIFLGCSPSQKIRDELSEIVSRDDSLSKYQIDIFYEDQIERQIQNVKEPKRFVREDKIKFSRDDRWIKYKDNGLLVSVYANSLKDLYEKYRDEGLFEQNFRYFVRNKKIDD